MAEGRDRVLRIVTMVVGTPPLAVLLAVCVTRFHLLSLELRFALGFLLALPIWVVATCLVARARSGARAALACVGLSLLLAGLLHTAPAPRQPAREPSSVTKVGHTT